MNNSVLLIQWGQAVVGREAMSIELFLSSKTWWAEVKNKGEIADYNLVGFENGNLSLTRGCLMVTGTNTQILDLVKTEGYRKFITQSSECVTNLQVLNGYTGELLDENIKSLVSWRKDLGI